MCFMYHSWSCLGSLLYIWKWVLVFNVKQLVVCFFDLHSWSIIMITNKILCMLNQFVQPQPQSKLIVRVCAHSGCLPISWAIQVPENHVYSQLKKDSHFPLFLFLNMGGYQFIETEHARILISFLTNKTGFSMLDNNFRQMRKFRTFLTDAIQLQAANTHCSDQHLRKYQDIRNCCCHFVA